jgi:hypothetical protein
MLAQAYPKKTKDGLSAEEIVALRALGVQEFLRKLLSFLQGA